MLSHAPQDYCEGDQNLEVLRILSEKVCGRLVPGRHPRVSQDLLGCQSSGWVDVKHLRHDVLGEAGHGGPVARAHVVLTLPDPLEDVLGRVLGPRGEGRLPRQHREEENPQAPDVTRSIVTLITTIEKSILLNRKS